MIAKDGSYVAEAVMVKDSGQEVLSTMLAYASYESTECEHSPPTAFNEKAEVFRDRVWSRQT